MSPLYQAISGDAIWANVSQELTAALMCASQVTESVGWTDSAGSIPACVLMHSSLRLWIAAHSESWVIEQEAFWDGWRSKQHTVVEAGSDLCEAEWSLALWPLFKMSLSSFSLFLTAAAWLAGLGEPAAVLFPDFLHKLHRDISFSFCSSLFLSVTRPYQIDYWGQLWCHLCSEPKVMDSNPTCSSWIWTHDLASPSLMHWPLDHMRGYT